MAGVQRNEWFLDDGFWAAFRALAFGPVRWDRAPNDVANLLRLLSCEGTGARVLDLCCGPGRYALELARLGFTVTAVDMSDAYLSELQWRSDAAPADTRIDVIRCDMRTFNRPNAFDAALCVGLSFGYFATAREDAEVLSNLYQSLKFGARCVLEVPSLTWPEELGPWYVVNAPGAQAFVEQVVAADQSSVNSRWHLRQDGDEKVYTSTQRLFSDIEVRTMLADAGFCEIDTYADYCGTPLLSDSRRIVAVAKKGHNEALSLRSAASFR